MTVKCSEMHSRPDVSTCQGWKKNKLLFLFFFLFSFKCKEFQSTGNLLTEWTQACLSLYVPACSNDCSRYTYRTGWRKILTGQDRNLHFPPHHNEALTNVSLLCIFFCVHSCVCTSVCGWTCMHMYVCVGARDGSQVSSMILHLILLRQGPLNLELTNLLD